MSSLDGSSIARVGSPASTGRASPHPRVKQRDDDDVLRKDKGLRRYAATVERVLREFVAVEEWADYISFLSRLLKALQAKPTGYTDIAHKLQVAKRLSQCLNPVLPSGVHQKTLEVYTYIFSSVGKETLAADLNLYLPGLAPTLSFASLSVKPNVLNLYESYVAKLDATALRPALKALILALLPSLEEENSEEFDWASRILDKFKTSIAGGSDAPPASSQYFWQCLFLASITSSTRRPGALAYLVRNLPQLGSRKGTESTKSPQSPSNGASEDDAKLQDAILAVASPEPGLLIRCFCAGLRDEQLLIQRGFLDLLVTHLPLHSQVLQSMALTEDLRRLITAATSVVARRDMSLNRRLWSWFLGPEPTVDVSSTLSPLSPRSPGQLTPKHDTVAQQSRYFEENGLQALIGTIKGMITRDCQDPVERSRPLRVSLSLLDKWELGSLLVPQIFLPALQSAWKYQKLDVSKEARSEVLKSANMFFDAVESSLIWSELAKLIARALSGEKSSQSQASDILDFVLFVMNNFNIREEEMQIVHMPLVCLFSVIRLSDLVSRENVRSDDVVARALQITLKLIELIPIRALRSDDAREGERLASISTSRRAEVLSSIESFYTRDQGNVDMRRPIPESDVGMLLLCSTIELLGSELRCESVEPPSTTEPTISIVSTLIRKGPRAVPVLEHLLSSFKHGTGQSDIQELPHGSFATLLTRVATLETITSTQHSAEWVPLRTIRQCIPGLLASLWPRLSPSQMKHNVEAARSLWKLQSIGKDDRLIESSIVTLMMKGASDQLQNYVDLESARRFATLWGQSQAGPSNNYSRRSSLIPGKSAKVDRMRASSKLTMLERPLLLLLDTMETPKVASSIFVVTWLQSLSTLLPVLETLTARLASSSPIVTALSMSSEPDKATIDELEDVELSFYFLQRILQIIELPSTTVWQALTSILNDESIAHNGSLHDFLVKICLGILNLPTPTQEQKQQQLFQLKQTALSLLGWFFSGPLANSLADKELEMPLLRKLRQSIQDSEHTLQVSIMEVLLPALRMRVPPPEPPKAFRHERKQSRDIKPPSLQVTTNEGDVREHSVDTMIMPSQLLECLILGMKSPSCRPVLESWVTFLGKCLPLYEGAIFQILLPLVECFCATLIEVLGNMQELFDTTDSVSSNVSEPTIALLFNGLEQTLAAAHEYLENEEAGATPIKSPEQPQTGFFGNMVSGVFTNEASQKRSATANKRLTVLLCFKDALRICFQIWSWGDSGKDALRDMSAAASFNYITVRLRNRTRRLFEHLFAVEPLECLETLIDLWQRFTKSEASPSHNVILNLLNTLENSRPKNTVPAIFDAIYSRTNPGALDPSRKSTLTSELTDTSLAAFLVTYARSLEDDAMDEIWADCSTFLKDVLANPMPHRQTLFRLIEFTAIIGNKVDKTTFGEQRKMRRELGDLFNKLLAATLTIRPVGVSLDNLAAPNQEKPSPALSPSAHSFEHQSPIGPDDLVSILALVTPDLPKILIEHDRIAYTTNTISTSVLLPIFRSKTFPSNITSSTLDLMKALAFIPEASRASKKDVTEAFNNANFFSTPTPLVRSGWFPVLRSWALADKERMPELLSRFTSPTSAGFLGVGATSARLDADRRTQLNLRRITTLILAAPHDTFIALLPSLQDKITDLLTATPSSSPSSLNKAEIYMLLRALLLRTSPIHLSSLWPALNAELFDALAAAYPGESSAADNPGPLALLQACKLLDALLVLGLDDFQMQEWLFVADTTDAVYRPHELRSVALVDDLAESLDDEDGGVGGGGALLGAGEAVEGGGSGSGSGKRRPLLTRAATRGVGRERVLRDVVRPFLRQLSIQAFEGTYGMLSPDLEACVEDLVGDLFDEGTLV